MKKNTLILFVILCFTGCTIIRQSGTGDHVSISQLKLIGEYDIPHNLSYMGTTIGGLSGIDYDRKNDVYYLISDDRSAINPARF